MATRPVVAAHVRVSRGHGRGQQTDERQVGFLDLMVQTSVLDGHRRVTAKAAVRALKWKQQTMRQGLWLPFVRKSARACAFWI